jgi:hypothetical protein
VIAAFWQTDRYPFSTEPVPGFEDSSNLDIVGAHRQVKRAWVQIFKGRLSPHKPHINCAAVAEDWKVSFTTS